MVADNKDTPTGSGPEQYYVEEVVEYKDNRRMRIALAAALVVLFFLLIGLTTAVVYLTRGAGAPGKDQLPKDVEWVRSIYGWGKTPSTSLSGPSDVAVAPDGGIWAISGAQLIVGFNPDGSFKKLIQPPRGRGEGQAHTLEGIMINDEGKIYVTDEGKNKVMEFDQDGKWLGEWGIEYPIDLASTGDGKLAVTAGAGVAVVTEKPELINAFGKRGKGDEDFDLPKGIVVGEDGTLYIADTQNQRVSAYTQKGKRLWTTGVPTSGIKVMGDVSKETSRSPFELPSGMTMDGKGRLVLVDAFRFHIYVLDAKNGKILHRYGDFGEKDGYFAYPSSIAYDAERDWFVVADTANNRLQIMRIPDSGGSPADSARRMLARPLWIFCLPLILLLAAVVLLALKRRRDKERESAAGESPADAAAGA